MSEQQRQLLRSVSNVSHARAMAVFGQDSLTDLNRTWPSLENQKAEEVPT
jgi:hypothetical protein